MSSSNLLSVRVKHNLQVGGPIKMNELPEEFQDTLRHNFVSTSPSFVYAQEAYIMPRECGLTVMGSCKFQAFKL
jgi:hypothetical protein